MPYWVLQLTWGVAALLFLITFTDALLHILFDIHTWLITPAVTMSLVALMAAFVIISLIRNPRFKLRHFVAVVVVRLLPFEVAYTYKIIAAIV